MNWENWPPSPRVEDRRNSTEVWERTANEAYESKQDSSPAKHDKRSEASFLREISSIIQGTPESKKPAEPKKSGGNQKRRFLDFSEPIYP